ncbi:MAG: NAD(P)-dependent oxidoreductase [Candidatus Aenigmarchaeota archaeon]|nr:NAD(P)-dependent oxidoreductase [Candidatus Aenigmarchaeota archaeon]
MRVLITGGTGFVGNRLAKKLMKNGHEVVIFASYGEAPKGAKLIKGDILNKKEVEKTLSPLPDVVYHLAAILDETDPMMKQVNIEGTINFLKKGIKRFILVSSVGVLGEARLPLDEDAPYNPDTGYEESKMQQEKLVKESGIPYTIIRSTIAYGPNKFWSDIIKAAKKRYPMIGSGKNFWHLIYVDDMVDALALALKPEAKNEIFNIADGDPKTYREIYKDIADALGVEMPTKTVPVFLAKLLARLKEKRRESDTTTKVSSITRLVRNRIVDISKARRVLGYKPKYDFKTGIRKTIKELGSEYLD